MNLHLGAIVTSLIVCQVSSELKSIARSNNEFALKLHKTFPPSENTFHSPASIFIALGMLYRGARGTTAREMRQALSYDPATGTNEFIHQEFAEILRELGNPFDEYELQIANAMVSSSNYPISEEYKESLKIYYRAMVKNVDFKTEKKKAIKEINGWINEKTKGKIPNLLDNLEDDTVMVLLNAVYFKSAWKTQFAVSNTREDVFYAHGKNAVAMRMMYEDNAFFYRQYTDFHCLKLPYNGEGISMVILLPFERNGLKDLEDGLTIEKLMGIMSDLKKRKVRVAIPKFKLEDERKLNKSLKQLGMRQAFQDGRADFRGIDNSRRLYVSAVIHKAMIEVNEEGSEAAAGTVIISNSRSGLLFPEFRADHPFLFLIWEERMKMILFMGRINQL